MLVALSTGFEYQVHPSFCPFSKPQKPHHPSSPAPYSSVHPCAIYKAALVWFAVRHARIPTCRRELYGRRGLLPLRGCGCAMRVTGTRQALPLQLGLCRATLRERSGYGHILLAYPTGRGAVCRTHGWLPWCSISVRPLSSCLCPLVPRSLRRGALGPCGGVEHLGAMGSNCRRVTPCRGAPMHGTALDQRVVPRSRGRPDMELHGGTGGTRRLRGASRSRRLPRWRRPR